MAEYSPPIVHSPAPMMGGTAPVTVAGALTISMMCHFMKGASLDAKSLAVDVIHNVGPGGGFLTHKHTLKHFRDRN